jgi:mercuric ion transport protein
MRDRTIIAGGMIAAAVAAVCCATPLLAILFGSIGLAAWLAAADMVLIPALILCLLLIGFGLYRRRRHARRASSSSAADIGRKLGETP